MGNGNDLRYALRMLLRKPGFTLVAVLALALGIGANTAIFSVVNAVLLQPLAYRDPSRLVMVWQKLTSAERSGPLACSIPDYIDYRDQSQTLDDVAAVVKTSFNLVTPSAAERISAAQVSANVFPLVGVAPLRGRVFTTAEDQPGSNLVAVLSFGAWQRRFASDPEILGKTLVLDRQPYRVIGIMPKEFDFPPPGLVDRIRPDVWVPIAFAPKQLAERGDNFNTTVIARLKPEVSIAQASADVDRIAHRIYQTYPPNIQKLFTFGGFVRDLHEQVTGDYRTLLLVLLGAVGFVLLIGCANVANLLLAQASGRRREIAIRTALGAGRVRLVRQLLTESVLLALAGGAAGVLIASWLTQLLIYFSPGNIPRLAESQLSAAVLGFAVAISVLTGIVFGLAPALQISKGSLATELKEGGRSAAQFRRNRLRSALVVTEVALSLMLLAGAGLLLRSFVKLRDVKLGFQPDHIVTLSAALPEAKYQNRVQIESFFRDLMDRMETLPGVVSASASTSLPLIGQWTIVVTPEGQPRTGKGSLNYANFAGVTPDFHRTLGIVLKKGRLFTSADRDPDRPVAVVNEAMARRYWPNQDVLGKRFKWGVFESTRSWITVVGVVGDVKQTNLALDVDPAVYLPFFEMPTESIGKGGVRGMLIAVRTTGDPSAVVPELREAARSLDPEVPLYAVRPMEQVLSASVAPRRFNMLLLGSFAALALLLASIGIYGVISYSVSQYTHEIGIRMALGARAADVVSMIVRQGMTLVGLGLAAGAAGGLALTRVMSTLLYGVKPTDPATFIGVSVLLAAVALTASLIPARRATRVDPMIALRYE